MIRRYARIRDSIVKLSPENNWIYWYIQDINGCLRWEASNGQFYKTQKHDYDMDSFLAKFSHQYEEVSLEEFNSYRMMQELIE